MKSLILLQESAVSPNTDQQGHVVALAHDPVSHTAFLACYDPLTDPESLTIVAVPGNLHLASVPLTPPVRSASASVDFDDLSTLPPPDLAGFHYLADQAALFVALADCGSLYSIPVPSSSSSSSSSATLIGSIHSGLSCAAWSPDEDLLVLVSRHGNTLLMTRDFDVLVESPLLTDAFGAQVPVSLGWGKKETQFHGSAGKAAALAQPTGDPRLSPWDDGGARVAWNGDGSAFAVSSVDSAADGTKPAKRTLRYFSREGMLQATSQPVDLLEHPLAWRPAGNLVASTQRAEGGNKLQVVFFEPNGLRHGEFALRTKAAPDTLHIKELAWNCDSSVLLLWLWDAARQLDVVQLWTMGNYHWYLKYDVACEALVGVQWDAMHPLTLHVALREGMYRRWRFSWDVLRQSAVGVAHAAAVGVVDGDHVLHTPFALANVPPPYALSKLHTHAGSVRMVAWCADADHLERVAIVSTNTENKLVAQVFDKQDDAGRKLERVGKDIDLSPLAHLSLRQLHFATPSSLVFLGYNPDTNTDHLVRLAFVAETGAVDDVATTLLPFAALRLALSADVALVQDTLGRLHQATWDVDLGQYLLPDNDDDEPLAFDSPCEWMALLPTPDTHLAVVGLTSRSKLQLAHRLPDSSPRVTQVSADTSSFLLHAEYLIYTTLAHKVHFLPLATLLSSSLSPASAADLTRAVERGAHLITVLPRGTNLVLQMPRGNLETVAPRALVLDTVVRAMRANDWHTAFALVRKHRIEFNLLADLDLDTFLASNWVDQLANPDHVNLVLSNLHDATDVVASVYPWLAFPGRPACVGVNKVARVCAHVRAVLGARPQVAHTPWVTTLITTHVKCTPPDRESALALVKQLTLAGAADAAERALKYTCFLVPVDQLYDVALGMYDFPLTLMVAQRTSKDPREYLPWLQELRAVKNEAEQRWRIDCALGRVERAVSHGVRAVEGQQGAGELWAQVKAYVREKGAYAVAVRELQALPGARERLNEVLGLFGQHLTHVEGKHVQAAQVFELGGHLAAAMVAYEKAGAWQKVLSVAAQRVAVGDDDDDVEDVGRVAVQLAAALMERAEHEAAATVLVEYVGDVERGVEQWIKAGKWNEAERQAYLHSRPDLIDTHLRPGLVTGAASMLTVLTEMRSDLHARIARLSEVRAEKKAKLAAMESGGGGGPGAHDPSLTHVDALSDTTSMMSTFTGLTLATASTARTGSSRKSSKTRRKNERKRHAGKKGSIYEEEYLVDSSHKCMARIAEFVGEVKALVGALVAFGYLAEAKRVQDAYAEAIEGAKQEMAVVTEPHEPHPLQRQVDRYRLMVDEGLTVEQADVRLDAMEKAQRREPVKMPEPVEWKVAVLNF